MLQSVRLQKVKHDLATEQQHMKNCDTEMLSNLPMGQLPGSGGAVMDTCTV